MIGGLLLTFVLCLATVRQFLAGATPAAFGDALRIDGLSALVLKAVLIPWFLTRIIDRIGIHREIEGFLNVPASLLVCLGLTVVGYRVSTGFPEGASGVSHHLIGVALSMLLIGLFLMVTRKKATTQILALLTVENAVFVVAVGVTPGMPLIVELGIAFDVIVAVLVLGVLVRRIVDRFESMDVSRLSTLKG